jgi:hypothetical protein
VTVGGQISVFDNVLSPYVVILAVSGNPACNSARSAMNQLVKKT